MVIEILFLRICARTYSVSPTRTYTPRKKDSRHTDCETTTTHSLSATTCTTRLKFCPSAMKLRHGRLVLIICSSSSHCSQISVVERGPGDGPPEGTDLVPFFFFFLVMYLARRE